MPKEFDKQTFRAELQQLAEKHGTSLRDICQRAMFLGCELADAAKPSQEQLREAFGWVQNKQHWKNPIDARLALNEDERELVAAAVVHFAGCVAEITPVSGQPIRGGRKVYRVRAVGYYAAVGA